MLWRPTSRPTRSERKKRSCFCFSCEHSNYNDEEEYNTKQGVLVSFICPNSNSGIYLLLLLFAIHCIVKEEISFGGGHGGGGKPDGISLGGWFFFSFLSFSQWRRKCISLYHCMEDKGGGRHIISRRLFAPCSFFFFPAILRLGIALSRREACIVDGQTDCTMLEATYVHEWTAAEISQLDLAFCDVPDKRSIAALGK